MIEVQQINFNLKNTSILHDISFSAVKGDFLSIVGPNGAGKSSLLSMLANEIQSENKTRIFFKEKNLMEWKIGDLAFHKAKFSQQYSNDLPLQVKDVVMMGRYPYFENEPHIKDVESVDLWMKNTDIFEMRDRDYTSLSGGEKQRVHIARAFTQLDNEVSEKIMFLDEPLNNLDIKHQYQTLKLVKEFTQKGNTAVVVLHDLNLASRFSDKVILMDKGKIIAHSTPDEVFSEEAISKTYNFPCTVCKNPISHETLILFG